MGVLRDVEGVEIWFFVGHGAIEAVDVGEGVLVFEFFVETCGPEVEETDVFLFEFGFVFLA